MPQKNTHLSSKKIFVVIGIIVVIVAIIFALSRKMILQISNFLLQPLLFQKYQVPYPILKMLLVLLSSQLKTIPVTGSMDHTARRIIFKLFHMKIPESKQMCIQNIVIGTL